MYCKKKSPELALETLSFMYYKTLQSLGLYWKIKVKIEPLPDVL